MGKHYKWPFYHFKLVFKNLLILVHNVTENETSTFIPESVGLSPDKNS